MIRIATCITTAILFASTLSATAQSADADKVWPLEKAYWHYVQTDDLDSYRSLWHGDFLGWPSTSPEPLRKEHITDWISTYKNNGEVLKSYDLEKLKIQVTGNVTTTTYRIHGTWVNKSGTDRTSVVRIIHTLLRDTAGSWQIISGMSAPTNPEGH